MPGSTIGTLVAARVCLTDAVACVCLLVLLWLHASPHCSHVGLVFAEAASANTKKIGARYQRKPPHLILSPRAMRCFTVLSMTVAFIVGAVECVTSARQHEGCIRALVFSGRCASHNVHGCQV